MTFRSLLAVALLVGACDSPAPTAVHEEGDPSEPDGGLIPVAPVDDTSSPDLGVAAPTMLAPGVTARVTAGSLNLRDGAGTTANVLTVMPCGATVMVVGGPSTTPVAGWWNVTFMGTTGWASGKYLVPSAQFDPSVCGGGAGDGGGMMMSMAPPVNDGGAPTGGTVDDIFARAKLGVGYSYYWGHGSWRADGTLHGTCVGTCPSCTHTGQYGADCSGFVAKAWQVPSPSPIEVDAHPYSTYNFYNEQVYWKQVPRSTLKPADAMVHRVNGEGHIVLFESGTDPFGATWLYEARGCATGVVHDLRTVDTTYIAIRKNGL
jgi:hypothetical protein